VTEFDFDCTDFGFDCCTAAAAAAGGGGGVGRLFGM
jgi:hypothetical protein